tara:strand:- start:4542 stop:6923 length:2382 start_codon:yes stop_codon:yes gene_type:complete
MGTFHNVKTPPQRLSFSKKGKEWRKNNVDNGDNNSLYHNEGVRQSLKNRVINLNLYNGVINTNDMKEVVNPYGIDADFIPKSIPHHPIAVPKIDLLVGEEIKRRFDWSVVVTNPNAVTAKENDRKNVLTQRITQYIQGNYSEQELESKMKDLEKYMKYEWQDVREKMANQILKHYWEEQKFAYKFNDGFKDAMIMAEEIYQVDIVADEPILEKLNPLKVRAVRNGNSNKIEDSSIIVIEDHWSPAKIVDTFYGEIKPTEIDTIMKYGGRSSKGGYSDDDNNHVLLRDSVEDFLGVAEINGHNFGSDYTDPDGNIRVLRVYWRSYKKIKKVKYYDEEGEAQFKFMSEEYIPNKDLGEEVTDLWVNEIWEGTKIGKEIYIQMRPKEVQFNRLNNKSQCHAGIIGQVYNTNQGKGISLMDRCKNYQYLYDAIWDRLNKAIATNYGKIFELDISKIPDNWEVEKWMHFAIVNKIAIVDSFKEGSHGASTGKLAGSFNTQGGRSIDMESGNYIQQQIQLLEFIKMEMGEIVGVSQQRQGQISNRETVGGVERAVNQSSHITEHWFMQHENVKLRVLTAFLETAKIALKGKNPKVQYILDDQTIQTLNVDGDVFCEADYGVVATNSSKTQEMEQTIKGYAQSFLQNGGNLSTIMDIYFSPSLADMRRKIEIAEDDLHQKNSESSQQQSKLAEQQQAQELQLEQAKMTLEDTINIRDNDTKLQIASLNQEDYDSDVNDDGIGLDAEKLNLEERKFQSDRENSSKDLMLKIKSLNNDMTKHSDNVKLKEKQIKKAATKPAK